MPNSPYDTNYGTNPQVEYARAMAKFLREKKGFQMTPGMAVLPGSWAHGLGDVVDAVSQGRYQDIAGQQDKTLTERKLDPNYVPQSAPSTVGSSLSSYLHGKAKDWFGGGNKIIPPGTEPKENIVTGSLPTSEQESTPKVNYADEVKRIENEGLFTGKTKESKAQWDFKQHTNGFGTRAKNEGEVIGPEEAHSRFDNEWQKAQNQVDQFKPGLPAGPRAALSSLTFNSGTKWMDSGLGAAVQSDDAAKAKELFTQYNKVRDKDGQMYTLAGLKERRDKEAKWFDDITPSTGGIIQAPNNLPGKMNLGGPKEDLGANNGPQGQQMAQYTSTPSNGGQSTPVQNNSPPGYTGAHPPAGPLESTEQLRARLLGANPDEHSKILEDYMKRAGTQWTPTPGGHIGVTPNPGGQPPQTTFIPGGDIPLRIGDIDVRLRQVQDKQGNVSQKFLVPGGPDSGFGSFDDAKEWLRQQKAKDVTATETAGEQVKHYQNEQQTIQNQGEKSKLHLPQLSIIQNLIKDPANYVGVGADKVLDAKKVLDFMGFENKNLSQPASMEVLQKLIASSNLAAMEQLRGFGQVRSTDLRWLEQSNATTTNRPEAIQALTDIAKRMHKRSVDIQDLSQEYRDKHGGNLNSGWDKHLSQWTADHPLFEKSEIDEYKDKLKEKVKEPGTKGEGKTNSTTTSPNVGGPRKYVPGKGWVE